MSNVTVLSLGGSIIAPSGVDTEFLKAFYTEIKAYLDSDKANKIILVCGGGSPARVYQSALREVRENANASDQDWIGIKATHLNGYLVKAIFSEYCENDLVIDPTLDINFTGQILVAAGWKPGFSTDTDAVYLAEKFNSKLIVNLSNIAKVYTDDPKKNPEAKPLDSICWQDFIKIVGTEWKPGINAPFDPIATGIASKNGMKVICADGRNISNTMSILKGEEFFGTTIG